MPHLIMAHITTPIDTLIIIQHTQITQILTIMEITQVITEQHITNQQITLDPTMESDNQL